MDRAASPQEAHEAAPNPTILGLGASLQKSRTQIDFESICQNLYDDTDTDTDFDFDFDRARSCCTAAT
jgi:hypothetical protein